MSTVIVETVSDRSGTGPTNFVNQWAAKMYVKFDLLAVAIDDSFNVASLTDQGTGDAGININSVLRAAEGATQLSCGLYSTGVFVAVQTGAEVVASFQVNARCGSDTTTRNDWQEGHTELYGDFA